MADDSRPVVGSTGADPVARDGRTIGRGAQIYMIVALLLVTIVAGIDRNVVNLLVQDLKRDLGASDGQLGLLLGLGFSVINAATAILVGALADRFNRKRLALAGAVAWSLFTMASGLARTLPQLALGRVGVGFSEGGLQPINFSLVRDGVHPSRRGRAFSVILMATGLSGALSFIFGAVIYAIARHHAPIVLPVVGALRPWQEVLLATGLLGLPVSLLLLPIREPARRAAEGMGYGEILAHMRTNIGIYAPLVLLYCLVVMSTAPYMTWVSALLQRNWHLAVPQVGKVMGPVLLVAPALGYLVSGWFVDRMVRRGGADNIVGIGLVGCLVAGVFSTLAAQAPGIGPFIGAMGMALLFTSLPFPVLQTILARVTPAGGSGKAIALIGLVTLIAQSFCAWGVGALSDALPRFGTHSLAMAISLTQATLTVAMVAAALWLGRAVKTQGLPES